MLLNNNKQYNLVKHFTIQYNTIPCETMSDNDPDIV